MKKTGLIIFIWFFFLLPGYVWTPAFGEARPYGRQARAIRIGQSELTPGAYLHFRASYTEDDLGAGNNTPDSLEVVRARFYLDGQIMRDTSARFEYDLRTEELLDVYIEMGHFPYADWTIRIGQFKIPFSEAGLVLATPLQETIKGPLIYEGRSITFTPTTFSDRETGILVQGGMLEKKGIYTLGVFNGNGINQPDDNDLKDWFIQFQVAPWKEDVRSRLKPLYFGAAYMSGEVSEPTTIGVDTRKRYAFTMKYELEKSIITYESFLQTLDIDGPEEITTESWYVQLSRPYEKYFLKKRQEIQAIIRYEFYDPDKRSDKDEIQAWTIGGSWQINKALRLQLNYNIFNEDKDVEIDNNETLIQLEVRF